MQDEVLSGEPAVLAAILHDAKRAGFKMASEPRLDSLLRTLAASKPGGRLLEIGTGTGIETAWLLDGMDLTARLDTMDNDATAQAVDCSHLGQDAPVRFFLEDGGQWLREWVKPAYDLIFADSWPGKYDDLDLALWMLAPGGLYVVDDLSPQPEWSAEHTRGWNRCWQN